MIGAAIGQFVAIVAVLVMSPLLKGVIDTLKARVHLTAARRLMASTDLAEP